MDDLVDETNETFFASLTQSGSTVMVPVPVSPSQTLVVIVDDDATPTSPPEPEMMGIYTYYSTLYTDDTT